MATDAASRGYMPPSCRGIRSISAALDQPLLRRNSRFCDAGPCELCTTESPSRCASPSRLCAFFLSSASLNLRFMSSVAAPVGLSSVLMPPPYAERAPLSCGRGHCRGREGVPAQGFGGAALVGLV